MIRCGTRSPDLVLVVLGQETQKQLLKHTAVRIAQSGLERNSTTNDRVDGGAPAVASP